MKRTRAFSLLELMFSMFLILLVVGLGIIQTRPGGGTSADSKSLALQVSAELRAARSKAMRDKIPVAVVLPSAGGTVPHSQSIYNLEGSSRAKITRYVDFSGESGACLAVATWTSSEGAPELYSPWRPDSTLEGWPRTPTTDYIFMYTSEGRLVTNDLPLMGGQYHIVCLAGLDYAAGGAPSGTPTVSNPPTYFSLTGAYKPVTIAITPAGAVTLKQGLPGASSGSPPEAMGLPVPPAPPVPPSTMPNTDPLIEGVTVYPAPVSETSSGFDAVLPLTRNGFPSWLELTVQASDGDGDVLTCEWETTPITGTDPGQFTVGRVRLSSSNRFTWNWYPPSSARAGDRFRLASTVTDELGASVTLTGSAAIDVEMRDNGIIVYQKPSNSGRLELWLDFGDGPPTREVSPFQNKSVQDARISPDGTKVVCSVDDGGNRNLYIMNLNGTRPQVLVDAAGDESDCAWSHDGTQIVYTESYTEPPPNPLPDPPPPAATAIDRFMRVGAGADGDEAQASVLTTAGWIAYDAYDPAVHVPVSGRDANWSKDGLQIAYISDSTGDPEIWVVNADGTAPVQVASAPAARESQPRWSPDNNFLMFISDRGGTSQVYTVDPAAATPTVIQRTTDAAVKVDAAWSPQFATANGGQILYTSGTGGGALGLYQADMQATGTITGTPRSLSVNGLVETPGANPDWGP